MTNRLIIFGSIICLKCFLIIVFPQRYLSVVQSITITTPLRLTAFIVRVLIGSIMLLAADSTHSPLTLQIIGILLIISGAATLLLGNARLQLFLDWILRLQPNSIRAGAVAGIVFGGSLFYAVF